MTSGYNNQANGVAQRHSSHSQNGGPQQYSFVTTQAHPAQNGQTQQHFSSQPQQQQPPKARPAEPQRRQATPPQSSPEMVPTVAKEFVDMYYNRIFNCEPGSLFKFYMENSTFSIYEDSGIRTARGIDAIRKLFQELLQDVQTRLDRFDCQLIPTADPHPQQAPPVLIHATGLMAVKGRQYGFSQSFILVNFTQNGYYVQNDIMILTPSSTSTPAVVTKTRELAVASAPLPAYALPPQAAHLQPTWAQSTPPQVLMPSMDPVMALFTGVPAMNGTQAAPFMSRAVQQPSMTQNGLQPSMKVVAPPPALAPVSPAGTIAPAASVPTQATASRPAPIAPPTHQPPPPAPTPIYEPMAHHHQQQLPRAPVANQVQSTTATVDGIYAKTDLPNPPVEPLRMRESEHSRVVAQDLKPVAPASDVRLADPRRAPAMEPKGHSEDRPAAPKPKAQHQPAPPAPEPTPQQPTSWASVAKARPQPQLQAPSPNAARPSAVAAVAAATAALGTTAAAGTSPAGRQAEEAAPAAQPPHPMAASMPPPQRPPAAAVPKVPAAPAAAAPQQPRAPDSRPPPAHPHRTHRNDAGEALPAHATEPAHGGLKQHAHPEGRAQQQREALSAEPAQGGPKQHARGEGRVAQQGSEGRGRPGKDRSTLLVWDLPEGVGRQELVDLFSCFGTITAPLDFELEPFKAGVWHAFIPFATSEAVDAAVQASHKQPVVIRGTKIVLKHGGHAAKEHKRRNGSRSGGAAAAGRDHATVRDQQNGSHTSSISSQGQQGVRPSQDGPRQEPGHGGVPRAQKAARKEEPRAEGAAAEPRAEGKADRRPDGQRRNSRSGRRAGRGPHGSGAAAAAAAGQAAPNGVAGPYPAAAADQAAV